MCAEGGGKEVTRLLSTSVGWARREAVETQAALGLSLLLLHVIAQAEQYSLKPDGTSSVLDMALLVSAVPLSSSAWGRIAPAMNCKQRPRCICHLQLMLRLLNPRAHTCKVQISARAERCCSD